MVSDCLLRPDCGIPEPVRGQARLLRAATVARHLAFVEDAARISSCLTSAGIPHAFLKGPVIAGLHHVVPTTRTYLDLDLLVDPNDLGAALTALQDAGCRLETQNWPLLAALVPAELMLCSPAGTVIDLHWHLVMKRELRRARGIDTQEILARRREVVVHGVTLPALDATDTLLHLCVHGADAGGDRLLWLFDIHSAVTAEPPDWAEVVRRSRETRVTAQVALMLGRSSRTFGTRFPPDTERELGQRSWTRLDAAVESVGQRGSAYPAGSLTRTVARASRERLADSLVHVIRRGSAWLRGGGPWAPVPGAFVDPADPRSGLFDGGGDLADYLAVVVAEPRART